MVTRKLGMSGVAEELLASQELKSVEFIIVNDERQQYFTNLTGPLLYSHCQNNLMTIARDIF
jgi:hypothetical protein